MKVCAFPNHSNDELRFLTLTYNIRLGFCCQLSIQRKQTERKSNVPFKAEGGLHSSSSPYGIILPTRGTLDYCPHFFTPSLHCDYTPRPFPVASGAPPTGVDVVYFPGPMDTGPGLVTCFGQLNVGNVTVCQFRAKALRGTVCFYTLPCVSGITMRQAHPREPGCRRHME